MNTARAEYVIVYMENGPFDEELVFFSKMATDRTISLSFFLEVEVTLEV